MRADPIVASLLCASFTLAGSAGARPAELRVAQAGAADAVDIESADWKPTGIEENWAGLENPQPAVLASAGRPLVLAWSATQEDTVEARRADRLVWFVSLASAGGPSASFTTRAGWNGLFASQPRMGDWYLDLESGKKLARVGIVHFAPDGSWALSEPPREHFSGCYQASRPLRLRLTGAPRVHRVDAAPVPKSLRCHGDIRDDYGSFATAVGIARSGTLYAVANEREVALFRSRDDAKLASTAMPLAVDQARGFALSVMFTRGEDRLVVRRENDAGTEEVWLELP